MTLVEINDFSGMLNLRDAAYKLRPNEARDIRNIIASPSGEARLRGGYDLWGDTKSGAPVRGIHRFYTPTLMHLLAASGTGIYVDTGSGTFIDVIARDLPEERRTPDQPHRFATWDYKQECYAVNGADAPIRWNGQEASVVPGAPVGAQHVLVYANRLWMGNLGYPGGPTTLRWSALGNPDEWPGENVLETSQPITGLLGGFGTTPSVWSQAPAGQLWIFEPGRIEVLIGDGGRETTLGFRTVVDGIGCVAPNTLAVWGGYAFFLADDGVYRFDGRRVQSISDKLGKLLRDTPAYLRQKAWGAVSEGRYWLSIPTAEASENSVIYVYDLMDGWWTRFTEIQAVSLFGTPGNPTESLDILWGDASGRVWRYRPDSREDARIPPNPGKPIVGYWKSGVFIPEKGHIFQFRRLRFQIKTSEGDTWINYFVDSNEASGSYQFSARTPAESRWDSMLWDQGLWASTRQERHVYKGDFPMRARGRAIEFELTMQGDGGWQSLQVLGYPVRELR